MKRNERNKNLRTNEHLRKDGLYSYNFRDPITGKRKYIYARTLAELREKEKDLNRKLGMNLNVTEAKKMTLDALFDRYILSKFELRNSTRTNYIYMYDRYIRDGFGKRKLDCIHYSDIDLLYKYLHYERGLKLQTVDIINNVIHPTLQMAVRDQLIPFNPSDGVLKDLKQKSQEEKRKVHALTMEQQRIFLNYVRDHPVYGIWYPMFVILLGTGMRISEQLGLRWADVDMNRRMIHVEHGLTYRPDVDDHNRSSMKISKVKTAAGVRLIPMFPEVYEAFRSLENRGYKREVKAIDGYSDFVFLNRYGQAFKAKSVNSAIARITQSYNEEERKKSEEEGRAADLLPHFTCHSLRHSFCSRLIEAGAEAKFVQIVMGHSDVSTTLNIYAEISEQRQIEMLNSLYRNINIF